MDADKVQRVIDLGRFNSADEAKAGSIEGRFLFSILLTFFFILTGRTWIHSIGGGTSASSSPSSSRHHARAAQELSCLGAGGLSGSGGCGSACGPGGCGSCCCDLRHCSSRRGWCCHGCGPTPAPDGIEIRAAVPPLLSHTQCFD